MKKFIFILKVIIYIGFIFTLTVQADDLTNRIGIGAGNPYISIKYGLTPKFSVETRGAFGSGISVGGARLYYNLNPNQKAVFFLGGEGDYVSFDTDDLSGNGYVGYIFTGGEYFISKKFTFTLDIGPALVGLKEDELASNVEGVEWLFNLGINWYFN